MPKVNESLRSIHFNQEMIDGFVKKVRLTRSGIPFRDDVAPPFDILRNYHLFKLKQSMERSETTILGILDHFRHFIFRIWIK